MSPTRTTNAAGLFDEVKSLSALKAAWDHVRPQATKSNDPEVKRERATIDGDVLRYLRALQRDLGSGRFTFERQKGVLKTRDGKAPRPIVVAPLRSRVVQRAILDVCQSDRPRIRRRLGRLPSALATPTSVGGLPGKGVATAIHLIKTAVRDGATHYVRSDLKNFFGKLPKAPLHSFLDAEVNDPAFVQLFKDSLDIDLTNATQAEIQKWWALFPSDETGVPQGSALSAISANIVLADFDRELNLGPVTMVRYLDDFLILGPTNEIVADAWQQALQILGALDLEAHLPGESDKAAVGAIEDGFEFLSFRVQGTTIAPTRAAKADLLQQIDQLVRDSRREIQDHGGDPRRTERRFVQSLDRVDRKVRGWGDSFKETTQRVEFVQLDRRLSDRIDQFVGWFLRIQETHLAASKRRMWGIALLADTPRPDVAAAVD